MTHSVDKNNKELNYEDTNGDHNVAWWSVDSLYTERHHRAMHTNKRPDENPARSYLEAMEDSLRRSQTITSSFWAFSFYDCRKHTSVM